MSCTKSNASFPSVVAQQPTFDFPFCAPAVDTITAVLQNPKSQKTDVDSAIALPAEHDV